jgi:phenylacetate-coenzyme A ligase PaaK-like adenylate-forming protein
LAAAFDEALRERDQESGTDEFRRTREHIDAGVRMDHSAAERRLADLLTVAREQVPYYGHLADSQAGLADFPMLTKRQLRSSFADLVARSPDDGRLRAGSMYMLRTSGSTGEPVSSIKTEEGDGLADMIIRERVYAACGLPETGVALAAPLLGADSPLVQVQLYPRPFVWWNLRGLEHCYDRDTADVLAEYDAIVGEFDVDLVYGTSSRVIAMALYCRERDIVLRPTAVVATYEEMPASGRALVEEVFGAPVTMMYGTSETGLSAFECPDRSLHFQDDWVVCETLPHDRDADSIVLTSLKSDVMPILRYVTGDLAVPTTTQCDCGLPGRTIAGLHGRSQARLVSSDGRVYSPYLLYEALIASGLHDFQIVQSEPGVATLVTPASGGTNPESVVAEVNAQLGQYFADGSGLRLLAEASGEFVLTPVGKRNPVVQRLHIPVGAERI